MDAQNVALGKRLKELRKKRGLSLQDVGNRIGKSRYTVRDYEDGVSGMGWSIYMELCFIYGVNADQLANEVKWEVSQSSKSA